MKKLLSLVIALVMVLSAFNMAYAEDSSKTTTIVWEAIRLEGYSMPRTVKVTLSGVIGKKLDNGTVVFDEYDVNYLDAYEYEEEYVKYEDGKNTWTGKGELVKNGVIVIPVEPGAKLTIEAIDGGDALEFFPSAYPFIDFEKKVIINGMGQADNYATEKVFNKKLDDMDSKYINEFPITVEGVKYGIVVVDPETYPMPTAEEIAKFENVDNSTEGATEEVKEESKAASLDNFKAVKEYTNETFTDIAGGEWFANDIKAIFELGIMGGKGNGVFDPTGNIKVSEAIAMVSRTKDIFAGGTGTIENSGSNWYDGFVKYAVDNGIITDGQFDDYNRNATRSELAYLFAVALNGECYEEINTIEEIADVNGDTQYSSEIFKLYKAGVITGSDEYGTFNPQNDITRAEASALINRVIKVENRKTVELKKK